MLHQRVILVALAIACFSFAPALVLAGPVEDALAAWPQATTAERNALNKQLSKSDRAALRAGLAILESPRTGSASVGGASVSAPAVLGTIQYDDGIVTAAPVVTSNAYGNRFDTAKDAGGTPLGIASNGSITKMSFFIVSGAGTDNVFISLFDQLSGTSGNLLTSLSVPLSAGSGALNVHTFGAPINYSGNTFLAGVWYVAGDTVGLGGGTRNSQGHHGMHINDIVVTGFTPLPNLNALVRVAGDVLPVELMNFEIE